MSIAVYIINTLILLLLSLGIYRHKAFVNIKPYVLPALVLKLVCGIFLGLLYHHYYKEGDTLTFKNASLILTDYAKENPFNYIRLILFNEFDSDSLRASLPFTRFPNFSNSFFFLKLLSIFNLFTNSSYYLNSLYFSLFSFWGTATLVSALIKLEPKYKLAAIMAFLYFPSVVFWSSGVLKDALIFGSMCWLIGLALELASGHKRSLITWVLLPLMLYLFVRLKFFLALIIIPLLLMYLLIHITGRSTKILSSLHVKLAAMVIATTSLGILGAWIIKEYNGGFFYTNMVETYNSILSFSKEQPHIEFTSFEPTLRSMVSNGPEAILSAIFKPFIWEAINPLYLLMGAENAIILLLSLMSVIAIIKANKYLITERQLLFILVVLSFGIIIGLTTPNFGTLSRYRISFLPFFIYLLLQNRYSQRVLQKLG